VARPRFTVAAVLVFAALALGACKPQRARSAGLPPPDNILTLGPGDKFELLVFGEEKLPKEYIVAGDGTVQIPWIGKVEAAGLEPLVLQQTIHDLFVTREILKDPLVTLTVKEFNSKRVTMSGAFAKAGEIPFTPGLTLLRAVSAIGGFAAGADRSAVLVIRTTSKGVRRRAAFNYEDIAEGRASDVPLQAGDNIYANERAF